MKIADEKKLKDAFMKIKDELSDHLEAINGNTEEINLISAYNAQLEKMIIKLSERIDALEIKLSGLQKEKSKATNLQNITLNPKEQEIFLMLYEEKGELLDYRKLARHLGLTSEIVRKTINNLIEKGVPIIKKEFDGKIYLILDADFRNLQAKNNIIRIQ